MAAAFVQQIGTANSKTSGANLTITVPAGGTTAGNTIVVAVGFGAGAPQSTPVSDTAGNTYHRLYADSSTPVGLYVWAAYNAAALSSGNTIVVTGTAMTSDHESVAIELSGVASTSAADGDGVFSSPPQLGTLASGSNTSTPSITGAATSWDSELVMGLFVLEGPSGDTWTATNGNTAIAGGGTSGAGATSNSTIRGVYRIESSRGTKQTSGSNGGTARNVLGVQIGFASAVSEDTSGPLYRDSTGNSGTTSTSVTVTRPSGTVDGDLMVVAIVWDNNTGVATMATGGATGWTLAQRMVNPSQAHQVEGEIWTKPAANGDPSPWTFTLNHAPSSFWQTTVVAYSNADTTTPVDSTVDYASVDASGSLDGDVSLTSTGTSVHLDGRNTATITSTKTRLFAVGWHSGSVTMHKPPNFNLRRSATRHEVYDYGEANSRVLGYIGWTSESGSQALAGAIVAVRKSPVVNGSLTANAVIKKTQSASFTADAVTSGGAVTGSFTASAVIKATRTGSLTANAVQLKTMTGGYTGDGIANTSGGTTAGGTSHVLTLPTGIGAGDLIIAYFNMGWAGFGGASNVWPSGWVSSFEVNLGTSPDGRIQVEYKVADGTEGSTVTVTTPAGQSIYQIHRIPSGSYTGTPVSAVTGTSFSTNPDPPSLTSGFGVVPTLWIAGAHWFNGGSSLTSYPSGYSNGQVTSNGIATARKVTTAASENPGTFAITLGPWQVASTVAVQLSTGMPASAILKATRTGSFTASASISGAGAFSASAIIKRAQTGSFTADASIVVTRTGSLTADAVLKATRTGSFAASALILSTQTGSFTANAVILRGRTGSFTADAAIVTSAPTAGTFTVDAVIKRTASGSFTADAWVRATIASSFTASATLKRTITGSFTADAARTRSVSSTFTANAALKSTRTGSLTASAVIKVTRTGSLTADAWRQRTVTGSFTANAIPLATQTGSFTFNYATYGGVGPTPAQIGVPTRIFIGGVEVTGHVKWATAEFTAKVNSANGTCSLDIIDKNHDLSFSFGEEILIHIDGILRWGGWVIQATRSFPFPMLAHPTSEARMWHIEGIDYNRILDRRVLHDSSNPDRTWNYAAGTYDDTIFNNIWPFFDTTGFTKDIHRVGQGVLDIPGVTARTGGFVAQGGFSMRDVLMHLSWDTGAIFYVTPHKVVTYVDADLVTSPYTLTDTPSGPMDVGFHDVKILEDSTEMVNDAIVWGAGKGSSNIVKSRYQSTASQDAHGVWQAGNFTAGIYKQATADAVAQARVEGSPVSHRGAKNPKRAVTLLTWEPVFSVGDVVNFHDSQFLLPPPSPDDAPSHDDVLPIRTMRVTWPTPYHPLMELQLSWEVDAVWSFFDPWLPVGPVDDGGPKIDDGGTNDPSGECDCGTTDSFTRTTTAGWGVSDSGVAWTGSSAAHRYTLVDGTRAVIGVDAVNGNQAVSTMDFFVPVDGTIDITFDMTVSVQTPTTAANTDQSYGFAINTAWGFEVANFSTGPKIRLQSPGAGVTSVSGPLITGTVYHVRWQFESGVAHRVRIWPDGDPEPGTWTIQQSNATALTQLTKFLVSVLTEDAFSAGNAPPMEGRLDNLVIPGLDRCTAVQFENFNRMVGSGWGVATPSGLTWIEDADASTSSSVSIGDGGSLVVSAASRQITQSVVQAGGPFSEAFTMTAVVDIDNAHGVYSFQVDGAVGPGAGTNAGIALNTQDGLLGIYTNPGTNPTTAMTFTVGHRYNVVWDFRVSGTLTRVRVWDVSTADPGGWTLTADSAGLAGTRDEFDVTAFPGFGQSSAGITIKSIDFDYGSRPCYLGCSDTPTIFDDFTRAAGATWGSASSGPAYSYVNGTTPWTTTGTEGQFAWPTGAAPNVYFGPNGASGGTDLGPWQGEAWTFSCRFKTTSWIYNGSTGYVAYQIATDQRFIILGTGTNFGFSNPHGFIQTDDSGGRQDFDWQPDTYYRMKWYYNLATGDCWLKVWIDGNTEPDWLITRSTYGGGGGDRQPKNFALRGYLKDPSGTVTNVWDDFAFAVCDSGTPPPAGGGVSSGSATVETLTPLDGPSGGVFPAGSHWQATNAYLIMPILAINGTIQLPNVVWFPTEPENGIVRIDVDVSTAESVTLDYIANGTIT